MRATHGMKSAGAACLPVAILWLGLTAYAGPAQQSQAPPKPRPAPVRSHTPTQGTPKVPATAAAPEDHTAVIRKYCVTCHNDTKKTGGLSLSTFDVARAAQNAEVAEKM